MSRCYSHAAREQDDEYPLQLVAVDGKGKSHLTRRYKLQWPQRTSHIRDVGLEVVESVGDTGFQLGRVLPRRAVGRDLVKSSHVCGLWD